MIIQRNRVNTKFRKRVKLVRFGDAVVVSIDPQTKLGVDRVAAVDDAVSVPTIFRLIEDRQRQEPIRVVRRGLGSEVSKQLRAIVDFAIAVAIQSKEGVGGARSSPAYLSRLTRVKQIKFHTACIVCKVEPRSVHVDNDRATGVLAATKDTVVAATVAVDRTKVIVCHATRQISTTNGVSAA